MKRQTLFKLAVLASAFSVASMPAMSKETPRHPNILVIVADDMGYSDLGAFGGEIATPNLDAIAQRGVKLTSFYTAPTCSPTRAMLLTGRDHHAVGMGTMAEALSRSPQLKGEPGYSGHLDTTTPTIAQRLSQTGYRTAMAGKWHLGNGAGQNPAQRGFQQSFALMEGGSDHFGDDQTWATGAYGPTYTDNGKSSRLPVGRYAGDYFTERMIGFLTGAKEENRPFFAYMAFTDPHWPLQAPDAIIDKYRGRYNDGPAVLRANRLQRMREIGLLDEKMLGARLETLEDWNALTPQQRAISSRAMEVYAAMVETLDANVGKLLDALRRSGQLDNTVIVFLSDNGAEGMSQETVEKMLPMMGTPATKLKELAAANRDPGKIGRRGSYTAYGPQWAQAGAAPFHLYKGFTDEGGIRTPAFVAGPDIVGGRTINSATSVRDIMPTLLAIAGVQPDPQPTPAPDADRLPEGRSLMPILSGQTNAVRDGRDAVAWELFFHRGIRLGDWKAVYRRDEATGSLSIGAENMRWRLFNLADDPGESTDVSAAHPDVLERLTALWWAYAKQNGVYAEDDTPAKQ